MGVDPLEDRVHRRGDLVVTRGRDACQRLGGADRDCVAVTPGTFLVAALALTIELPAVTRPRQSSSAVPVIVTRRVLVLPSSLSPLMLNCCCVSVGVTRARCKYPG